MASSSSFVLRGAERVSWPFCHVRRAFAAVSSEPHPLCVDGRLFPGLPETEIPVGQLREMLLRPDCSGQTRDQVWAFLVRRARGQQHPWAVVCLGLALPALTRVAAGLSRPFAGDPAEIHVAVLTGFAGALESIDLDRGRIIHRLRWAAFRAGHHAVREALQAPVPTKPGDGHGEDEPAAETSLGVGAPSGHPERVLQRAVAAGVLTQSEAAIIAATRLGEHSVQQAATARRVSYAALHQARRRAEARLLAWLDSPEEHERQAGLNGDEVATHVSDALTRPTPPSTPQVQDSLSVSGRRRRAGTGRRRVSKTAPAHGVSRCQEPSPTSS